MKKMQKIVLEKTALVLVDIQNDFLPPSGSLAVPNGDAILPVVHQVLELNWALIIASQVGHFSFSEREFESSAFKPFQTLIQNLRCIIAFFC